MYIKKLVSMFLAAVLALSMGCVGVFAETDEIPADLPEGTIKIMEGVYAYTPEIEPYYAREWTTISQTIPALGNGILRPRNINDIRITSASDRYLNMQASKGIKINLISGNYNIFGTDEYTWPTIGTSRQTIYYFAIDTLGIARNVTYQLECVSSTGSARTGVEFCAWSSINPRQEKPWVD